MAEQRKYQRPGGYWSGRSFKGSGGAGHAIGRARSFLESHKLPVAACALVIAIIAAAVIMWPKGDPPARVFAPDYYFNLSTGKVETRPAGSVPPFRRDPTNPNSATMVSAHIMSCGSCAPEERFVGYLEQFGGETKRTLDRLLSGPTGPMSIDQITAPMNIPPGDRLVASPDDLQWVEYSSEEGQAIRAAGQVHCGDKPPRPCIPTYVQNP